ncbi:Phenylpropionate dioxygenase, large terminal subunit [Pseudomonas synxantha]|uniref:Phenylpropionate dioxygenase, large terminal subunit n=1 Tax=Pseudomonas synxantha TaxID=47883 RepID=A0A3G7U7N2_9PSED|nr:Rieske 2Fe-2S domain-containing protein [Pseudomonas synxantha]AZE54589.1 Phenylpropionate dioxygenase, large terminal subunit [Pseudomonas synxantha]
MQVPDHTNDTDLSSFPYPDGWFVIATADELKPGAIITKPFMGRDVVLYRTKTGVLRAVDPYCPHLGAHLGDGKIEGEDIVCPYHKFAFAPDGRCVRTGCGDKPPQARLGSRNAREWNGLIAVWQSADGHSPDWELPEFDWTGYSAPIRGLRVLPGSVQNPSENGFDPAHLQHLHGWENGTSQVQKNEGHRLDLITRITLKGLPIRIDVNLHGLGLMAVEVNLERAVLQAMFLVTPAQIAPLKWTYRESMRLRVSWLSKWPAFVQKAVYGLLAPAVYHLWYVRQLQQDIDIWERRSFIRHPKPSATDAPLVAYRRWSMQFYPSTKTTGSENIDQMLVCPMISRV